MQKSEETSKKNWASETNLNVLATLVRIKIF